MLIAQESADADLIPESLSVQDPMFTVEHAGVSITIVGTAHVSRASAERVRELIEGGGYDAVALELCPNRYQSLTDPDALTRMDLGQVLRQRKGAMVMAGLALSAFQQRVADQLGVRPGEEMRTAIDAADKMALPVLLIDRDMGTTLKRIYRNVPWTRRITVLSGLIASVISRRTVSEDEIERLKDGDVLEATFNQFAESSPDIYDPLVDERDRYMVARLMQETRDAGYERLLVVVGAGHVAGMRNYFGGNVAAMIHPDKVRAELESVPPPSMLIRWLPWLIVAVILIGFGVGFSQSSEIGWQLVRDWVLINGGLAAIGGLIAAAHPVTVISAFAAAPLTSLNPTISAGFVSAVVESMIRKPQVGDFSRLREDTCTLKGWWGNRISRTLLVFFFTGLGSVIGTYVAGYRIFESISAA